MASYIGRRKFLATLGGAVAAWPLAARAQQAKVPTIGALVIGNINPEQFWREFRQGLHDLGYVEGQSAKQATGEIPIVMAETGDPVGLGLVASLPRPGGNVTGMTTVAAELAGKSVQLIRDMLPSARRVTALANATDPFSKPFLEQIELGGAA